MESCKKGKEREKRKEKKNKKEANPLFYFFMMREREKSTQVRPTLRGTIARTPATDIKSERSLMLISKNSLSKPAEKKAPIGTLFPFFLFSFFPFFLFSFFSFFLFFFFSFSL